MDGTRRDHRRNARVPYDDLDRAIEIVSTNHPGADEYRPVWAGDKILVEAWKKGAAKIYEVTDWGRWLR